MIPLRPPVEDGTSVTSESLIALRRYLRPTPGGKWHPDQRPAGFPGRRRGAGLETIDVRPFSEGDDVRHLDRNVTARIGTPHVRTFREARGATLLLIADFRRPMQWGTRRAFRSVAAAEALALGGWRAVEQGGRVGLHAIGGPEPVHIAPRGRAAGMLAVAGGLAIAHAAATGHDAPEPELDRVLETAMQLAPVGTTLILATALDDPGPDFARVAGALARYDRLRVLLVRDSFETSPPPGSYSFANPDGTRHWASISATGAPDPRPALLDRLGIATLPIDTAAGPEAAARAWDWFDGPLR